MSSIMWENCGEGGCGGGDGSLVVARRFKQVLARVYKLGCSQHVLSRVRRCSCTGKKMGKKNWEKT